MPEFNEEQFQNYYKDEGCHIHPACLSCPLPACVEDEPPQRPWAQNVQLDAERANAVLLASETMTRAAAIVKVAKDFQITERTMWRILGRVK